MSAVGVEILTRVPTPGRVKTRMAPALGDAGAADLHAALAEATFDLAAASGLPVTVHLEGDLDHPFAMGIRRRGFQLQVQAPGDLGARIRAAMSAPGRRVVLGTDCVVFEPDWLRQAVEDHSPVVLGPAEDGGYWCLAANTPCPALFENIPWSTDAVVDATRAAAARAGHAVSLLPTCYDVDTPADLARLRRDPACPPALARRLLLLPA